jgi:hypothetical protein
VVEKTFEVAGTADQAWERLAQLTAAHHLGPDTWWLPGFECEAIEVAAVAGRHLEVVKAGQPCKDTTIVFTFNIPLRAPGST